MRSKQPNLQLLGTIFAISKKEARQLKYRRFSRLGKGPSKTKTDGGRIAPKWVFEKEFFHFELDDFELDTLTYPHDSGERNHSENRTIWSATRRALST